MCDIIGQYKRDIDFIVAKKCKKGLYGLKNAIEKISKPHIKRAIKKKYEHIDINTCKRNYIKSKTQHTKALLVAKLLAALTEKDLKEVHSYILTKLD
jgi:hypothetical protein